MKGTYREVFPKDGGDGEWIDTPDLLTTEQSMESLGHSISKWSDADKQWAREQLRQADREWLRGVLLRMKCSETVH